MTTASSDYKTHARRLREALAADGIAVSHGKALELVARQNGARDWNTLSAQSRPDNLPANETAPAAPFAVTPSRSYSCSGITGARALRKPAAGGVSASPIVALTTRTV